MLRKLDPVDFSQERMICCCTSRRKCHFLVDADRKLWIIAFRQVNILPETFMYFALGHQLNGDPMPRECLSLFPVNPKKNLRGVHLLRQWFLRGCIGFCEYIFGFAVALY
jgi:hypothetical protein